ncbi:MAG TPA: TolC family protein [Gemmatimonadaceae bacterium]
MTALLAAAPAMAAGPLAGQATPGSAGAPPLTVTEAMALARARHPALAAASARGRGDVALVRRDAAFANPVLEWRQENLASPLAPDAFLTIVQPLDVTGRRLALRAEVPEVAARAAADSVVVARDVEAAAAGAFWRAALARALAEVAATQRADAERLAAVEAVRAQEGAVAELSALRAGLEAERARLAEATARAEWARAIGELARAVGMDAARLPAVPALSPAPPPVAAMPAERAMLDDALARRAELAAGRAAIAAAGHRLSAERRGTLPDVSLQAGTKRTAGYTTRTVGVAVPLPLLDRNTAGRERAAAALDLARAELQATEQAVRAEVAAAATALRALLDARTPGADSLAARAAEVAQVADAAYAAGGGSLLELLDARRARAEALTAALRWAADLRLARLELNRASGAPLLQALETP